MKSHCSYIFELLLALLFINVNFSTGFAASDPPTPGSLEAVKTDGVSLGYCPLAHTDVRAEISGILARVTVTQQFQNPYDVPIEAVYTFPLPHQAAVDDMTIKVGARVIRGTIKERQEAQAIYERARADGRIAALLNQERPNIFRQYVANILPGQGIDVIIRYVETLKYENGSYQFVYPMVVGPRYISGAADGGGVPCSDQALEAARITPPIVKEGERAGHDISVEVDLYAATPFTNLRSLQHEIIAPMNSEQSALVRLVDKAVIPNKDFILSWDVAAEEIQDGLVTHRHGADGYFMLVLQPPVRVEPARVMPKEMVFVLDTSGSMQGPPIEKAIKTMTRMLEGLYEQDTFNVLTFSGDTRVLFEKPVPATMENLEAAKQFLSSHHGSGGTEMMKAIRAALDPSDSQKHLRMVIFMTDGYVYMDREIIGEVKKHPNARVFSFGIGTSVNRFLLDGMAAVGRGVAEYVTPNDDENAIMQRFYERMRNPLLTDITLEWQGVPVTDILPHAIPDVYTAQPVTIVGKYSVNGMASVRLRGKMAGMDYERTLQFSLPAEEPKHDVLMKLWAREKIKYLSLDRFESSAFDRLASKIEKEITILGLHYGLMTEYTSFVAVEQTAVTDGSQTMRVEVPVEIPEGVNRNMAFGNAQVEVSTSAENLTLEAGSSTGTVLTSVDNTYIPLGNIVSKRVRSMSGIFRRVFSVFGKSPNLSKTSKYDPAITALLKQLSAGGSPDPSMKDFVQSGKAEIEVFLTERSAKTLQLLKDNGFEPIAQPQATASIIGRIPLGKLESLAKLGVILRIEKHPIDKKP
jgi:Ca-activated chloride channel homolog